MNVRVLSAAALASTLALAACGGGGGGGGTSMAPAAPAPPVATTAPVAPASGSVPMSIAIPRQSPSGGARSAQFVSPGAGALAIYDGATLVYVANISIDSGTQFATVYAKSGSTTVAPGSCTFSTSTVVCTLTITSTVGAHKFDLIVYPQNQGTQPAPSQRLVSDTGSVPTFAGVISSEGELSVTLVNGTNPAATLTLLGVADQAQFGSTTESAYNATETVTLRILDSTNHEIVQPGTAYDNGPVTAAAVPSGVVTITPSSFATPPASVGSETFNVQCTNPAGGSVTITFSAQTHPNTAYASGLTYTSSNYSSGTLGSFPYICDAATGTVPITVQGKRHQ